MSKDNKYLIEEKSYKDEHPWDDLTVVEILIGLFCIGMVVGLFTLPFI